MKRADDPPLLHVRDWNGRFENSRTRDNLRNMTWIAEPVFGPVYNDLLNHPSGAAHVGVMLGIHMEASRVYPRGFLRKSDGAPHDVASLARALRMPLDLVTEVVSRLLGIGELEVAREAKKHRTKSEISGKTGKTDEISFPQVLKNHIPHAALPEDRKTNTHTQRARVSLSATPNLRNGCTPRTPKKAGQDSL